TPNIRFKGFHDEWEQRKLGEVGTTYTGLSGKTKEDFGHGKGKFITYMNVFSNAISDLDMIEPIEIDKKQNEVKVGDVFFTTSSETPEEVGMSCVLLEKCEDTYLNSFCFGYRPTEKFDNKYLAYMLRSSEVRKKITFLAQGISRYNISKNKMMEIEIPIPCLSEQEGIGIYFYNLDYLITLHQHKYDEMKQLKKFMLQKMFPKSGELIPEIRFAGFTGDWEQRKLGDITNILSASRVHKEEWKTEGVPFFRSSDVMAAFKGTKNDKVFISQELFEKLSAISGKPQQGDIFITGGGSIGTPYIVPNNEPLYSKDADLIWVKKSEKHDSFYLYSYFVSPIFREYLLSISHTGTIAHYTIEQVKKTPVFFPSLEEQQKIGVYFSNLDHLITLHQHKCDELQGVKKFMLQNMFV
ncbi:MAG: restriction endonuclease subunit S, partial [Lachnospiraceae bacterium]|nr:restriction endonuclease subunit S [Lachnospiraceae bacterium]